MNPIAPPSSLTKSAIKYPHRLAGKNQSGSYVQSSFARGHLEEIQYWIETGEVEKAMAGQTRYRSDYTKTLFTQLSIHLSRIVVLDQGRIDEFNAVLEHLWERGAHKHKHLYRSWMVNLVEHPFSDKLEKLGINPWDTGAGKWLEGQDWTDEQLIERKNAQADEPHRKGTRSPAVAALRALNGAINSYWRDNKDVEQQIIERFSRYLDYPGASEDDLTSCLGVLVSIDMSKNTSPVKAMVDELADRIIEKGAGASMADGDALYHLARNALVEELSFSDVVSEYKRREDDKLTDQQKRDRYFYSSTLDQRFPNEEQAKELSTEMMEQRKSFWVDKSQKWIGKLLPVLQRDLPEGYSAEQNRHGFFQYSQEALWFNLIQSPGGVEIARRIIPVMEKRGQKFPWGYDIEDSQYYRAYSPSVRQPYLLSQLVQLFGDPKSIGTFVSDDWKTNFARCYIEAGRETETNSNHPRFDQVKGWPEDWASLVQVGQPKRHSRRKPPAFPKRVKSPTADEANLLIDLLGIEGEAWTPEKKRSISNKHALLEHIVGRLPHMWKEEDSITPQIKRQEVLDVLASRGVLGKMLTVVDVFSLADGLGQTKEERAAQIAEFRRKHHNASTEWMKIWEQPELRADLRESLMRQGQNGQRSVEILEVIGVWQILFGVYSRPESIQLEAITEHAREVVRNNLPVLKAFEANLIYEMGLMRSGPVWKNVRGILESATGIISFGLDFDEGTKDIISSRLLDWMKATNHMGDDEQTQLIGLTGQIGIETEQFAPKLLNNLLAHEAARRSPIAGWGRITELCVDNRWDVDVPTLADPSQESLVKHVRTAILKRELKDVARASGRTDLDTPLPPKPKMKM